jgi:hypothetical protein
MCIMFTDDVGMLSTFLPLITLLAHSMQAVLSGKSGLTESAAQWGHRVDPSGGNPSLAECVVRHDTATRWFPKLQACTGGTLAVNAE